MTQRVTVRERIDPAITASLFANYRSSSDAVMELVDTAIDSRLKGMNRTHPDKLFEAYERLGRSLLRGRQARLGLLGIAQ
jgi:hypothetical protein